MPKISFPVPLGMIVESVERFPLSSESYLVSLDLLQFDVESIDVIGSSTSQHSQSLACLLGCRCVSVCEACAEGVHDASEASPMLRPTMVTALPYV